MATTDAAPQAGSDTAQADPVVWAKALADVDWLVYEDPHLPSGEQAARVKILAPNVFFAHFPPGFSAPAHAHPFDTTYYVTEGKIRFGDEGWVGADSVRAVKAGHVYGPEEAGPEGVQFLLVSSGPIAIDWAD